MIKMSPEEIIKTKLNEGEEALWAHVHSYEENTPKENKAGVWLWKICMLVFVANSIFLLSRLSREDLTATLMPKLPLIGFILLMSLLVKTKFGNSGNPEVRYTYDNCIITDRRVLLFNHYTPERQEFTPENLADVNMDYEMGGRALRFRPRKQAKDSILIGIVDFPPALAILQSRFLNSISTA